MTGKAAFPFLTIPPDLVDFGGWLIGAPGEPLMPAGDTLEKWDYETELEVGFSIAIDPEAVASALRLNGLGSKFSAAITVGTGAGRLPRRILVHRMENLGPDGNAIILREQVNSRDLSARLWLRAQLCLADGTAPLSSLSPTRKASRLWSAVQDILLEGGGDSRFPMEIAKFSECFAGRAEQAAPWLLHWSPHNLHHDFVGAVRLYVNADNHSLAERFIAGDTPTLQAILGDVMSQMIESALDQDDLAETLRVADPASIAGQIMQWIDTCFAGQDLQGLKSFRDVHPGRFRAIVLAAAEVGDTP